MSTDDYRIRKCGANSDEQQAWYKDEDIYTAIESVPPAQPRIRLYKMIVQDASLGGQNDT